MQKPVVILIMALAAVVAVGLLYGPEEPQPVDLIGYVDGDYIVIFSEYRYWILRKSLSGLPEVSGVAPRGRNGAVVRVKGDPHTMLPILVAKLQIRIAAHLKPATPTAPQTRSPSP